jgi:hypothetical protein
MRMQGYKPFPTIDVGFGIDEKFANMKMTFTGRHMQKCIVAETKN